jgi:hypothetical protein
MSGEGSSMTILTRTAVVLVSTLLLAGCLTSRQPLVSAENADYPIRFDPVK